MKIKHFIIKFMNEKSKLSVLLQMNEKKYKMLELIINKSSGNLFPSGGDSEKDIMEKLDIAKATYYNRLKFFESIGILKRISRGVYEFNKKWFEVIEKDKFSKIK